MKLKPIMMILALTACQGDETLSGYGATDTEWVLVEMNGVPSMDWDMLSSALCSE